MKNFRDVFLQRVEQSGASLRQVAEGSGVSYEQLKKLKQISTRKVTVDDAIRLARYFNSTVDEFISGDEQSNPDDVVKLLGALSEEARSFLLTAARAQLATEATGIGPHDEEDQ